MYDYHIAVLLSPLAPFESVCLCACVYVRVHASECLRAGVSMYAHFHITHDCVVCFLHYNKPSLNRVTASRNPFVSV